MKTKQCTRFFAMLLILAACFSQTLISKETTNYSQIYSIPNTTQNLPFEADKGICVQGSAFNSLTHLDSTSKKSKPAVTYALDCGRFGDQLINYIKALWVSHKYNLNLLYKPFDYSHLLKLSKAHPPLKQNKNKFSFIVKSDNDFFHTQQLFQLIEQPIQNQLKILYVISFQTPTIDEWEDETFRKRLSELVQPITPIPSLVLPQDCITIAIHVRTGVGYDTQENINKMPTKFPPDSFYIHGLKVIADYFPGQPLYIHLFTDHPNPSEIQARYVEKWKRLGIENEISVHFRASGNSFDANVLEDFFAMMQFDCLIRPDSSYSRAAGAISAPILEITPPGWGECRKDAQGNLIKDKNGNVIIDNLLKIRIAKGKNICDRHFIPIDENI